MDGVYRFKFDTLFSRIPLGDFGPTRTVATLIMLVWSGDQLELEPEVNLHLPHNFNRWQERSARSSIQGCEGMIRDRP